MVDEEQAALALPALSEIKAAWARGEPLPFLPYRLMVLEELLGPGGDDVEAMHFTAHGTIPEHDVVAAPRGDGLYVMQTVGLGRKAQPGGTPETGSLHLEFCVIARTPSEEIATYLSYIARMVHGRSPDDDPWAPNHRIEFEDKVGVAKTYALGFTAEVPFGEGPSIVFLNVIAMTEEEHAAVESGALADWILQNAGREEVRDRWQALLS